jgi:uncharacterized protein YydD (DUF2326 family)
MTKSRKEFEALLNIKQKLKRDLEKEKGIESMNCMLNEFMLKKPEEMPKSVTIMMSLSSRLIASRKEIMQDELISIEMELDEYDDYFKVINS